MRQSRSVTVCEEAGWLGGPLKPLVEAVSQQALSPRDSGFDEPVGAIAYGPRNRDAAVLVDACPPPSLGCRCLRDGYALPPHRSAIMPRYFFNVRDGRNIQDEIGSDLDGIEAARIEAVEAIDRRDRSQSGPATNQSGLRSDRRAASSAIADWNRLSEVRFEQRANVELKWSSSPRLAAQSERLWDAAVAIRRSGASPFHRTPC
jgi:hypothetical protein